MRAILIIVLLAGLLEAGLASWHYQARKKGEWMAKQEAQPHLAGFPDKYFACGYRFRQMSWVRKWRTCKRILFWKRCKNHQQTHTTKTNAIEFVFCHQQNWHKQIHKTSIASNKNTHKWRPLSMCPKDNYIVAVQPRFNFAYNTDLGLTGLLVKCESIHFSTINQLENWGTGPYGILYNAPSGEYMTGFQMKSGNSQLLGIKNEFKAISVITSINFSFHNYQYPFKMSILMGKQLVANRGLNRLVKEVNLNGKYTSTNKFINSQSAITNYPISSNLKSIDFRPKNTHIGTNYFSEKIKQFKFGAQIDSEITTKANFDIIVDPCHETTVTQFIYAYNVTIPYHVDIVFSNRKTKIPIYSNGYGGDWHGLILEHTVNTSILTEPIQGCSDPTRNKKPKQEESKEKDNEKQKESSSDDDSNKNKDPQEQSSESEEKENQKKKESQTDHNSQKDKDNKDDSDSTKDGNQRDNENKNQKSNKQNPEQQLQKKNLSSDDPPN